MNNYNYMTEEAWIKAQEEFEDDMTVKEFREAMEKRKDFEEIENKKPYELPYIDLF